MSVEHLSTLFPTPDQQAASLLDVFARLLNKTHPLRGKHRDSLIYGIRDLSRMLTDERADMSKDYMGHPATRAAYLRYFLPWNLYRLVRLFQGLRGAGQGLDPAQGSTVADLGAGPLTVPLAMWIALPELRERKLRFVCIDRTPGIMRDGMALLTAMAQDKLAWHMDLVKGPLHTNVRGRADLLVAANTLNELTWGPGGNMPAQAENAVNMLRKNMKESGRLLIVEPGTRRSGTILHHLRSECLNQGMAPLAPCPHVEDCPMPGTGNAPWCHFRLPADSAPEWLHNLSRRARLPKSDTSLSFLLFTRESAAHEHLVRAISGTFPLENGAGQYACSERGLVLLQAAQQSRCGWPGDLLRPTWPNEPQRDEKSGALILPVQSSGSATPPPRGNKAKDGNKARSSSGSPDRTQKKGGPGQRSGNSKPDSRTGSGEQYRKKGHGGSRPSARNSEHPGKKRKS